MGPDGGSTPKKAIDILSLPFLTPTTDKFKWRKQVQMWITTVRRYTKCGDTRANGILNALGLTLFNALDTVFASKVERSIAAGIISFDEDDEKSQEPAEGCPRHHRNCRKRFTNRWHTETYSDDEKRIRLHQE